MQTTKWGREGWCFLEAVVGSYPDQPSFEDRRLYAIFLTHLGQILPCIYCRQSYQVFIQELPLSQYLGSNHRLRFWLYLIHNKVNDKLRQQGYLHVPNPAYAEIAGKYDQAWSGYPCQWDFLYSVIFNYAVDPTIINQGDYLLFFRLLRQLIPNSEIRKVYTKYYNLTPIDGYLRCRETMIAWFYDLQTRVYRDLGLKTPTYGQICAKYEGFRASCSQKPSDSCRLPQTKN